MKYQHKIMKQYFTIKNDLYNIRIPTIELRGSTTPRIKI